MLTPCPHAGDGGAAVHRQQALAAGLISWHELGKYYTAIMPNVYLDKRLKPSLRQRVIAAWLWSGRKGVIAGASASALHGAKWVDDHALVELIWRNARAPNGVRTKDELLLDGEVQRLCGLTVTTVERTAFDLGRRPPLGQAITRLDALANATDFKINDVRSSRGSTPYSRAASTRQGAGSRRPRCAVAEGDVAAALADKRRLSTAVHSDPLLGVYGHPKYFLDMGWEDIMLAVEYDGEQHRLSRDQFVKDVERLEYIRRAGWTHIRVLADHKGPDVVRRVRQAWDTLTSRR